MVRTFIAVEISEEQRNKIKEMQDSLKEVDAQVKYVEPKNLHLTLRFLGELVEGDLEKVKAGCEEAVQGISPFNMSLEGIGVFPNLDYIKIIWVGVENGRNELIDSAGRINELVDVGKKDSRKFSPHITFARVKGVQNKDLLVRKIEEYTNTDFGEVRVDGLKIKKSELEREGPVYSDLYKIKL